MLMLIVSERFHFETVPQSSEVGISQLMPLSCSWLLGCSDFHCALRILHPYHHQPI